MQTGTQHKVGIKQWCRQPATSPVDRALGAVQYGQRRHWWKGPVRCVALVLIHLCMLCHRHVLPL